MRIWTVAEANEALPRVAAAVERIRTLFVEAREARSRVQGNGGSTNGGGVHASERAFQDIARELDADGIVVRDPETGKPIGNKPAGAKSGKPRWNKGQREAGRARVHCRRHLLQCSRHASLAWLLDGAHKDSACELALSDYAGGKPREYVIDRTFIDDEGVRWIVSFLSADRRRSYCLYEAPSVEAILAAARASLPPGEVLASRHLAPATEFHLGGPAATLALGVTRAP